ncbi:hypothetical protein P5P86_14475 [Nocardioides sp. BP30]|uniref:hypothetical protein n=1 Tax=Nocardioides sp. BP30 TaxID=3036374 RepID=UPI002468984C|nr:hypothetical protein [Nocardioides sp. BP30]WGL51164.1 hypothetical protein P5P86_14475 [Nocardioides sp. BP30]
MGNRSRLGIVSATLALLPTLAACSGSSTTAPDASASTSQSTSASPSASPTGLYDENLSHHPTTYGTLAPGFVATDSPPPPEGTFTPAPGSWSEVHPPKGYRVQLVAAAHDRQAAVTVAAVRSWARAESVDLSVIKVAKPADNLQDLSTAMKAEPDLLVSAGDSLVDAMALVTASAPGIRFLILGGELAEPTQNVTAVDWAGASYRGEGLGTAPTHDPASFTPERTGRAIRAGVAAVLTNWVNTVVWLS